MMRSLLFLLAGVGIGVLIAPEKGEDTRKKLADRFEEYKDGFEKIRSNMQLSQADVEDSIEENLLH